MCARAQGHTCVEVVSPSITRLIQVARVLPQFVCARNDVSPLLPARSGGRFSLADAAAPSARGQVTA